MDPIRLDFVPFPAQLCHTQHCFAPELIIALFALNAGLHEVVKASIVGSIMGNVLLVLGAAMFFGGRGRDRQYFNRTAASAQARIVPGSLRILQGEELVQEWKPDGGGNAKCFCSACGGYKRKRSRNDQFDKHWTAPRASEFW
jgi:hypothetical protein